MCVVYLRLSLFEKGVGLFVFVQIVSDIYLGLSLFEERVVAGGRGWCHGEVVLLAVPLQRLVQVDTPGQVLVVAKHLLTQFVDQLVEAQVHLKQQNCTLTSPSRPQICLQFHHRQWREIHKESWDNQGHLIMSSS